MKPSGRREVLNEARRRVERALASDDAGDELAAAVEALLAVGGGDAERVRLIAAVKKYRRLRGEV